MNKYPQELHQTVYDMLVSDTHTRNSDIALYRKILFKFYGTCDINKINFNGDIFSSIKRCRQKIQEENPYLGPCDEVKEYRHEQQNLFETYVRNY